MAWTILVAAAALAAGAVASSIALIGLGLDAGLDLVATGIVLWHLRSLGERHHTDGLRLISATFLAGAAYLYAESILDLTEQSRPEPSALGLAVAAGSLLVMTWLAPRKRRLGLAIGSHPLIADAAETALCAVAAAAALFGLGVDYWLGWWWTVPAAGLAIGAVTGYEGLSAWRRRH